MKLKIALASAIAAITLTACTEKQATEPTLSEDQQITASPQVIDDATAPIGKLTDLAEPTLYEVDLHVDPNQTHFGGSVKLSFDLKREASHFWLHGNRLDVSQVTIELDGEVIEASYSQPLTSGVAKIDFGRALPAGNYTANIKYSAPFDTNLSGLFKVTEQGHTYALAKSESVQARKFIPGFDEPGMKAPFKVSLVIPEDLHAITNTPEISREHLGNGLVRIDFMQTPAMPTYLLSLSVGPFDMVEGPVIQPNEFRDEPIVVRGFSRKGRGHELDYILSITPRFLEIFEEQLQSPYPFKKLDIIAAPAWPSGATELSAAITYRESRILLGENPAPQARLALLEIHAHEIAHMWFGNLVTPTWWDDLWLKEGFSTWMEPVALAEFEPEAGHEISAVRDSLRAMNLDSLASARAIREPITRNEDIRNAYDAITYSKSLGVIHMMDSYFGPELFRPALGRYVASYAEGRADSPEFYQEIAKQSGEPKIVEAFKTFVEQKGLPYLHFEQNGEQLTITQSRYAPVGSSIDTQAQLWNIPVCIGYSDGTKQCNILSEKATTWTVDNSESEWIMPNAMGAGYYRWALSTELWDQLINNFDKLAPQEAMSAVDSAIAAFNQGTMSGTQLKSLVEASAQSSNRHVVAAPLASLGTIVTRYLEGEEASVVNNWIQSVYQPVLASLADKTDDDSVILANQLSSYLSLSFADKGLRQELADKAQAFTGFKTEPVASALTTDEYGTALQIAVEDLGISFTRHLQKFADSFDDSRFRAAAINAIASSKSEEYIATQHEFVLNDTTESRESYNMLMVGMRTDLADQHWEFAIENFPAITAKVPAQWRRRLPGLGANFCDAHKKAQLNALFDKHADLTPGFERALAQNNERIDLCIAGEAQATNLLSALR